MVTYQIVRDVQPYGDRYWVRTLIPGKKRRFFSRPARWDYIHNFDTLEKALDYLERIKKDNEILYKVEI